MECKLVLPFITDELWEEYNETCLMTWKDSRPHWTQLAVDFACELRNKCAEKQAEPTHKEEL